MRKLFSISILSAAALLAMTPLGVKAAFTIGNLAVEQLQSNLTSSAFAIIELSPYQTNSSPVTSNSVPTTGASALRQTSAGTAGRLALTQDRTLIAFTGAIDGTGVADETTITNRGVGTFDANGKYTLQANYTNSTGSGDQARSATSLDDKTWYFGDKQGIYTNGINTPLNTTNVGTFRCFGGTVYAASTKAKAVVSTVSASGRNLTGLPGLPADANVTDFYMIVSGNNGSTNDILYVSDGATVSKYSLVSGSWVANTPSASLGVTADGLCAINNGSGAYLYVTTGTGGSVVKITDTAGYDAAPAINTNNNVVLYAGAAYLKGIDFAPMPNLAAEQLQQATTSSQFSIVELNPYQTNSSPVNSITIPITGTSALRQSSAASTGRLALTADRTLLAFSGAQDGTGVTDETTVLLRGAGTIDSSASGDYTLQTTYTGVSGNQARSATSLDKTNWYFGDKGGIYTNNTTTPLNTTNVRVLKVFGGQLIACAASSKSANPSVLSTVSADATMLTPLPGLESTIDANALDFYMIQSGVNGTNYDIAYVNDYGGNPLVISKYSLVSGSWTLNGTAALGVTADGICAVNIGGGANLYVTTGTGGTVVQVTDTAGYNAPPVINTANNVVLYAGAAYLKGIDFAPVGGSAVANNLNTPPTLTPDPSATVDRPFTNTFTDDPVWRTTITNVTVNSVTLSPSAYNTNHVGQIIFTPSASALLQSSGSKSIVIFATNYNSDAVAQTIGPGAPTRLAITTQPAAPTGNGGTLVTQPVLTIADQYGNPANNTATFTASVGAGAWSFGAGSGTNVVASGGTATFTNLSAVSAAAVSGATITFTLTGSGLGGLPYTTTNDSSGFNIPAPSTAFTPGNLAVEQEDLVAKNSTFSILELSPNAANQSSPVNTFAITATGTNALRQSSAATTGRLADSEDGTLVCFAAAETQDGSLVTTPDVTAVNPRGVGTLNGQGAYVLQTSYTGIGGATANQARSATSLDNTNWFIGDKGGVYTNGMVNPWIGGSANNVRSLKSFGGTVYALQQSSSSVTATLLQIVPQGDGTINVNGYPTISGYTSLYPVDGFPEDSAVLDFYMIQSGNNGSSYDVVYYIDGTNNTSGAIYKYYLSGTDDNGLPSYSLAGMATTPNGGDGLCAATNASGGVDLYYTTGSGGIAGNSLVKVTDSATWDAAPVLGAFQTNYTVSSQSTLKGVAFAPLAAPGAPTAITLTASNITASSATMDASVNPNGNATAYWFEYGPTAGYGSVTATNTLAAGSSPVIVIALLTGLSQGTVYHYQIVATNSISTSSGSDSVFATLAVTPPKMTGATVLQGGFQFSFTNATGASFSVLATNNVAAPRANWPVVGHATESPAGSGIYQFTNSSATNTLYYILRQP
jgi:hypothetical protein